jgi:hypothetical protein
MVGRSAGPTRLMVASESHPALTHPHTLAVHHLRESAPVNRLRGLAFARRKAVTAPWTAERKAEYFTWTKQVVDQLRGVSPQLEKLFDAALARRPGAR